MRVATDAQLEVMAHSLLDTINAYEKLPFGKFPEERTLREALITKLDILSWNLSPEDEDDE